MKKLGWSILAYIVGVASLFLVQFVATRFWGSLGVTWGPDNLPIVSEQQIGALTTLSLAVFLGSLIAALVSKSEAAKVLIAMCITGVGIDGYFMFMKLQELPIWFKVVFVGLIPIATFIAWYVARRFYQTVVQTMRQPGN